MKNGLFSIKLVNLVLLFSLLQLPAQTSQPNIVFILADDLGYGDLNCYGHPTISSPNLDQLADEGIRFTNFYAPSPLCSPSRAAMLTGRTPFRTGIQSWIPQGQGIYLHRRELTIAKHLKQYGYQTFLSGKWHLNGGLQDTLHPQPQHHGFDRWMALHAFALPTHKNPNNFYEDGKALGELQGFSADIVVDKAIEYIENRDKEKPFFLYLPMAEVHSEIASPDDFNARYSQFTNGIIDLDSLSDRGPGEYYANVTYMDDQIGRLLNKLETLGLKENTLILFTSDNGPVTNEWRYWWEVNMYGSTGGLRGRKADLFEGGLRVPCIISYPPLIKGGSVTDALGHGYDIFPTLCKIARIPIPKDRTIDGVDLSTVFTGEKSNRKNPLFWAFGTRPGDRPEGYLYAAREGDWKIIADKKTEKTLLYHLKSDPYEVRELSSQHPEKVLTLKRFIRKMKQSIADDPLRPVDKTKEVTILYTNDIESVYDPIDAYWNPDINRIGGMPQLSALIKQIQQKENPIFLFDSGDIFTGALSKASQGQLPFDIYSNMGYDAITLGNHEFEYGWQQLLNSKQRARFPVLNANIFYKDTDINFARSYTILEKEGIRIGIIGVMGVEAFHNTIFPPNVKELEVRPPVPIVQKLADQLRPEVDLLVVLTHQNKSAPMQSDKEVDPEVQRGFEEDYEMAGKVKGVDIILGGHSDHGLWEPVRHPKTGTLIGLTFGQGKYLGYLKLGIQSPQKEIQLIDGKLIPVIADDLIPDPDVDQLIKKARSENPELARIIGNNQYTGYRKYYRESNLGNFIADIMKEDGQADIGMINPGSIRSDLDKGPITKEEIINIYPFIDKLEVVEIDGKALRNLIEYSLSLTYGLVQFSGIDLEYDKSRHIGKRLIKATVNGKRLKDSRRYKVACTGYAAKGGDGFQMLKEGKSIYKSSKKIADHLLEYVEKKRAIVLPDIGRQKARQ